MDRPASPGGASAHIPTDTLHETTRLAGEAAASAAEAARASAAGLKLLTKAELFGNGPRLLTEVVVPKLGRTHVASLRQGQWEDLNARHVGEDGKTDTSRGYMNEAVAAALCEPDGSPMFEDPVEGAKQVRMLDLPVVAALFKAVAERSGLTAEAREALGKDFAPTPSAAD